MENDKNIEVAVFAGGCFWCIEAVFTMFHGILEILPGYTGGHSQNPCYEDVCEGDTGHAEAVKISFDPSIISYRKLLEIFFTAHNPTTLNQQGADIGTQYRSAIFYNSSEQELIAKNYIKELSDSKAYDSPIVTEVSPLYTFFEAEKYHQEYFKNNPKKAYCQISIAPKVAKIKNKFL